MMVYTIGCLQLFFEYFLVEQDRLVHVKWFGRVKQDIYWDKVGRMFYSANNKMVKAIKVDYGDFLERCIIFNNSLIGYKELAAHIYNKAKDNPDFSMDSQVFEDIKVYTELT